MSLKTGNAQSRATFFRHSGVLSLPAVLLRKVSVQCVETATEKIVFSLHADNIFESTHRIIFKRPNSQYHVACVNPPPDPTFDSTQLLDWVSDFYERMLLNDPNAKMIRAGKVNQLMI